MRVVKTLAVRFYVFYCTAQCNIVQIQHTKYTLHCSSCNTAHHLATLSPTVSPSRPVPPLVENNTVQHSTIEYSALQ